MIALDTNILMRYFVQDEPAQVRKATQIIESLTLEDQGFISIVVICELNWGLRTGYKLSKAERIIIFENIFSIGIFEIENFDLCLTALDAYKTGKADFADYISRETARQAGCDRVITFDKNALKEEGFASF